MVDGLYPFGKSLCRGEKPNQKRRPFLPLFYHIQWQMSTFCKRSNLWPVNPQIVAMDIVPQKMLLPIEPSQIERVSVE